MLFVCRENSADRICVSKSFTGKVLGYENTSGHNQVFGVTFQYRYTKSLKEAGIHKYIIHIRQQFVFIIYMVLFGRINTTGTLNLFRHILCQYSSYRIKDGVIIIGSIVSHYLTCTEIGHLATYHRQTLCLRVALLITQFESYLRKEQNTNGKSQRKGDNPYDIGAAFAQ